MNQLVIQLDANYKQLTPTQQAAWDSALTTYPPISICQCEEQMTTGQKLYRSVNFISIIIGQGIVSTPPISTWVGAPIAGDLVRDSTGIFGPTGIYIYDFEFVPRTVQLIQLGLGLNNPWYITDPTNQWMNIFPGDPFYDVLWDQPNGQVNTCIWEYPSLAPMQNTATYFNSVP